MCARWDPDFQGKMAFGVFGPVSVSAARRRLKAGAAKAPHGRRGQVSFGKFRVKVLHFMRTSPYCRSSYDQKPIILCYKYTVELVTIAPTIYNTIPT